MEGVSIVAIGLSVLSTNKQRDETKKRRKRNCEPSHLIVLSDHGPLAPLERRIVVLAHPGGKDVMWAHMAHGLEPLGRRVGDFRANASFVAESQ